MNDAAPVHKAEDVAEALAARLASCTVALGAETNLGSAVYRGRVKVDESMIPCSVIIEGDDVVRSASYGPRASVKVDQRYLLLAYVPCDPHHPNLAAHKALRDIKRAVFRTGGRPDTSLGGLTRRDGVSYLGRDIGPRSDGAAFVLAIIEIAVEYVEDLSEP